MVPYEIRELACVNQPRTDQKDVRERLRFASNFVADDYLQDVVDGLAEIDRLRAELAIVNQPRTAQKGPHTAEEWCSICDSYADENQRLSDEIDRLRARVDELERFAELGRAENSRLKVCIAARDELLAVKDRPSPEGLSAEEKLIWQLGNMMDNVENFYGAPNPKREGHIYSTAVRILDDTILAKTAKEGK